MTQIPEPDDPSRTEGCSPHPEPSKAIPNRLGSFRIESIIGTGGMGSVYRAYDESMRRWVALKVLHPSYGLSDVAQQRFARESWIAGQLEHPNIIRVYTRGEEAGVGYFAMELADGGSLAELIKKLQSELSAKTDVSRTVDSAQVRFLLERFASVADALEAIHGKGFIHRDIKPHNILLCGVEKQFKLTDFGIAHADDMTRVTRAGDFIGTVKYMSPELLAAHRAGIDKRTDIYSLGVTLYEALTLSLPYNADTEEKYVGEILAGRVVPARRRNRRLPVDLETVLLKATDHDPERRYQNAHELAEDLRAVLDDRPIRARRPGPVRRIHKLFRRHRAAALFMAVVFVVLVGGAWWSYQAQSEAAGRRRALQVLQSAVATEKDPADIDSEWGTLSARMAAAVLSNSDDSLVHWYHRASSTFRFSQTQLDDRIYVLPKSLNVLPSPSDMVSPAFALVTEIDVAADSSSLVPFVTMWSYYSLSQPSSSFATDLPLDSLFADSPGLHSLQFRLISRHFGGAKLFEPQDNTSPVRLTDLSEAQLKAAIQAGTLLSMAIQAASACRGRGNVIAISDADSSGAEPFLQDTVFERVPVVVSAR